MDRWALEQLRLKPTELAMRWSVQRLIAWHLLHLLCPCAAKIHRVLAIGAANSQIDWRMVQSLAKRPWQIDELELHNFGPMMKEKGFQEALEASEDLILSSLRRLNPDALLLQSKGVGIATWLAFKELWKGPLLLLSPIPNACDHISGGSWEAEWNSTMQLLRGPETPALARVVAIGTGTSSDEEDFIVQSIEDTGEERGGEASYISCLCDYHSLLLLSHLLLLSTFSLLWCLLWLLLLLLP